MKDPHGHPFYKAIRCGTAGQVQFDYKAAPDTVKITLVGPDGDETTHTIPGAKFREVCALAFRGFLP